VQQGDEKAFEVVFKGYYPILCTYACDLIKDVDLAREVVQEVLVKLWLNRAKVEINTSLKSYLYRSVHNHCINLIKHIGVEKRLRDQYEKTLPADSDAQEYTLDPYFYEGIEKDIEEIIGELPYQCHNVFYLSRFERLSYEAIAKKLNISVNTVKTQMRRALEKLRTQLTVKIRVYRRDSD
jgi:RNA polymerase sigma-70 factor (ECF subfamily)